MNTAPVTEADLHAYADGVLDEHTRASVEAHLAAHPEDAERVRGWRELNTALRQSYNPVLDEPVPERLAMQGAIPRRAFLDRCKAALGRHPAWLRYGAAVALLVVGVATGWVARSASYPFWHPAYRSGWGIMSIL